MLDEKTDGDDEIRPLSKLLRHTEFQLAHLVAAGGEAERVVALDEKARPAQEL